ncbi:MAG: Asp-tRNA(Asn)/Glu-tRNA(Gln) amidotransferase subunit GatA [Smithellaceae bacterium]|jgi:aspartyl-tRNA(Asn)/glutamyl-tRNA(Gln) amidotransferase subunit A|nr:Asp-tRNA(Asn)/Glu-tRNA(Gln) amidotransferase subunit GatA [Syntrophaceae bacterium]
MELAALTIHELQDKIRAGEVTAMQITRSVFERIDALEEKVHSYISLTKKEALAAAELADRDIKRGDIKPLTGIPVALKDIICTRGVPTTCASRMLQNYLSPYDATVVEKLAAAGAIITGKTNTDEFAMGSSTETSWFGPTHNPWGQDLVPGGSSGGSAAAVAADECIAAVGSDTGGSIRQPASLCGVVGLRPTYGLVSRFGLVSLASSLDQIGPLTKDVEDAAIMLNVLAGHDSRDATSVAAELPDYRTFLGRDISGMRIGVPKEYFVEGIDEDVLRLIRQAIGTLEKCGAQIIEISLPHTKYCVPVYCVLVPAEASSNLARIDGIRYGFRAGDVEDLAGLYTQSRTEGFGPEVKRRLIIGSYWLSSVRRDACYGRATQVRTLICREFDEAFRKCDIILTPATPTPAFKIGEKTKDPLKMYLSDMFTIAASLAGIPAVCVPCGFTHAGLPVGVQFMAGRFEEGRLLQFASAFEKNAAIEKRRPAL